MKIYFSRSVRGGSDDYNIYTNIMELLERYGEVLTDHKKDQNAPNLKLENTFVYQRDVAWVKESDVVEVNFQGKPTP